MVLDNEVSAFREQVSAFSMLQVNAGTKGICHPKTTAAFLDWTRRVEDAAGLHTIHNWCTAAAYSRGKV